MRFHLHRLVAFNLLIVLVCLALTKTEMRAMPSARGKVDSLESIQLSDEAAIQTELIGITRLDTLLFFRVENITRSKGEIYQRAPETDKVISHLSLSAAIDPYKLQLSPDGGILISCENVADAVAKVRNSHSIQVLSSTNLSTLSSVDLGKEHHIVGMDFINASSDRIITKLLSSVLDEDGDSTFDRDEFDIVNLKSKKVEKVIPYARARGVNVPLFSPDEKYLACLFYGEDESDQTGILDVLDADTGKVLWHLEGSEKQPIGGPFFFITPTKFVSSSMIYDISTKTSMPLIPEGDPRLECVSEVPQHSDYAFFMTKAGLELWNIKTKQTLHRWPTLTKSGFIQMAPDLKMFSYQADDGKIQFWPFDPAWLK